MSVMNGFRTELINKILGFNPHLIIKPYEKKINQELVDSLAALDKEIVRTSYTYTGQGILINKENTTGVLTRSYFENDIEKIELINKGIIDGSLNEFKT